jgi:hypothetical protein
MTSQDQGAVTVTIGETPFEGQTCGVFKTAGHSDWSLDDDEDTAEGEQPGAAGPPGFNVSPS